MVSQLAAWAKTPASAAYLSPSQRQRFVHEPLTGCTWFTRSGPGTAPSDGLPLSSQAGAAFATGSFCQTYYRTYGIANPNGTPIMEGVTNAGWCSNGYSYMWLNWGVNCSNKTYPIYGTQVTWCGTARVATSQSSNTSCAPQQGMNWDWWYWDTPWWHNSGSYMRTQVFCYSNGGSYTWGYAYDY
ncbi:MAG TPA: hypothetical protein VF137_05140 [Candidatus Dormibacteraeota bacterium]